jgi:ATP-dependent Clp endopeptidase proteolytic subunit ClpP
MNAPADLSTTTPLVDRFHFMARAGEQTKTPIRAEAPEPKTADGVAVLRLYDPIDWDGGFWGVSAKEFTAVLDDLAEDVETIELHINSPGGMVWDGLAIMNALRQHTARVVVIVDGIAASAASFIALAGDEVVMAQGAEMMVHSPFGLCVGNAQDMQKMATDLAHETDNLASIYQAKAGGTLDGWRAAMAAETWYSAEEAVAAGLADRVLDKPTDDQPKARFDLSVFAHAGRAQAPAPQSPAAHQAAGQPKQRGAGMDPAQIREALGLTADASDDDVVATAAEYREAAARAQADPPKNDGTPDPATLAEITRMSTELAELRAQAAQRTKDEHFASWLRDGKTSPAERAELEALYDAAPERTVALVGARAQGSVVPVEQVGIDDGAEPTEDDRLYDEIMAFRGLTQKGA